MSDFSEWNVIELLSGMDTTGAKASLQPDFEFPWQQQPHQWGDSKLAGPAHDHNKLPAQVMEKAWQVEVFGEMPTEQETLELKKLYGLAPAEDAEVDAVEFDEDDLLERLQPAIKRIVRQASAAAVKTFPATLQKRARQPDPHFDQGRKVLSVEDKPCTNGIVRHTKFVGGERMEFIETA